MYKQQAERNKQHLQQLAKLKKQESDGDSEGGEGGEDEVYYDEMEYDDELNDEEERDYKKSLQSKNKEIVVVEKKELPQRSTRGLRMSALVGKAQEEDDLFY